MNVTIPDLLQMIGEQAVEITFLRREVARLTPAEPAAPAPGEPAKAGAPGTLPGPVAVPRVERAGG